MIKKTLKDRRVCGNCKHFVWDSNKETGWCRDINFTLLWDDDACATFERTY